MTACAVVKEQRCEAVA